MTKTFAGKISQPVMPLNTNVIFLCGNCNY